MNENRACLSPDQIEAVLSGRGIQPTAQRIAICRYVLCEADHPSAEDVKRWADANFPKISLATVYNTLRILVEAGLLRELKLPHSDRTLYDQNVAHHFHFLDEATQQLTDIDPARIQLTHDLSDLTVTGIDVVFRGRRR